MPRVTVAGDLKVGSVGFLPAGTSEVDAEQFAQLMAHPLFAEDVASGRVKVEQAAETAPKPTNDDTEAPKPRRKTS